MDNSIKFQQFWNLSKEVGVILNAIQAQFVPEAQLIFYLAVQIVINKRQQNIIESASNRQIGLLKLFWDNQLIALLNILYKQFFN